VRGAEALTKSPERGSPGDGAPGMTQRVRQEGEARPVDLTGRHRGLHRGSTGRRALALGLGLGLELAVRERGWGGGRVGESGFEAKKKVAEARMLEDGGAAGIEGGGVEGSTAGAERRRPWGRSLAKGAAGHTGGSPQGEDGEGRGRGRGLSGGGIKAGAREWRERSGGSGGWDTGPPTMAGGAAGLSSGREEGRVGGERGGHAQRALMGQGTLLPTRAAAQEFEPDMLAADHKAQDRPQKGRVGTDQLLTTQKQWGPECRGQGAGQGRRERERGKEREWEWEWEWEWEVRHLWVRTGRAEEAEGLEAGGGVRGVPPAWPRRMRRRTRRQQRPGAQPRPEAQPQGAREGAELRRVGQPQRGCDDGEAWGRLGEGERRRRKARARAGEGTLGSELGQGRGER